MVLVGNAALCTAMLLVVLVPGLLALVFGWFAFRSKIKGVYFSIMTQALTYAGMLLFSVTKPVLAATTVLPDSPRCLAIPLPRPPRGQRYLWSRFYCCC